MLKEPVSIYINWAAYDELSDNVELTEALADRQLDELLRLRGLGVRFDYYLVDCFWFARDGGYRTWRTPHWPNGPERFLDKCIANGVKPGLWIGGNTLDGVAPMPAWQDSLDHYNPAGRGRGSMCMFSGGFWPHLLETLRMWYERGVRLYKFDFMNLNAATPALRQTMLPSEIRRANEQAFITGLKALRADCPEILLIGYNGFPEGATHESTTQPYRKTVGLHWLEALDSLYCGDPRPADVPTANFWRAKDIFSDHMVRIFEKNGYPLERIDNAGFMIGTTGTCYNRRTAAWKGMLLLSLARGGWVNTYYGNLDLLGEEDGRWFARAQALFLPVQQHGRIRTFGSMPGDEQPYGFLGEDSTGCLVAAVNPSQTVASLELPVTGAGRVLFSDAGRQPELAGNRLTLGPEGMAVIGFGRYNDPAYNLGTQEDVVIPETIEKLPVEFIASGPTRITATFQPPHEGTLRLVLRQHDAAGRSVKSSGGSPPDGLPLGQILTVRAAQNGQPVPVTIQYDKAIWSGLSWAVGEVDTTALAPGVPLEVELQTMETQPVTLTGAVYRAK